MKYEDICEHIKAKRQVRVAGNTVGQMRGSIALPLRVFSRLQCGRVRKYVEVQNDTGRLQRVDLCRVRPLNDRLGAMS